VQPAPHIVWVAGGLLWMEDAAVCRGCLRPLRWTNGSYHCERCGLTRPDPRWRLEDGTIHGPEGSVPVDLRIPGRANPINALFAVATAAQYGIELRAAMAAIGRIGDIAGRYREYEVDGRRVQLHLSKNAASWNESLHLFASDPDAGLICALDRMGLTGRDAMTPWDTPVELLAGRRVVATGELRDEVALRLQVAGAEPVASADPLDAIRSCPPGRVHVLCNYAMFPLLKRRLES
jgi:hypothetical protein